MNVEKLLKETGGDSGSFDGVLYDQTIVEDYNLNLAHIPIRAVTESGIRIVEMEGTVGYSGLALPPEESMKKKYVGTVTKIFERDGTFFGDIMNGPFRPPHNRVKWTGEYWLMTNPMTGEQKEYEQRMRVLSEATWRPNAKDLSLPVQKCIIYVDGVRKTRRLRVNDIYYAQSQYIGTVTLPDDGGSQKVRLDEGGMWLYAGECVPPRTRLASNVRGSTGGFEI